MYIYDTFSILWTMVALVYLMERYHVEIFNLLINRVSINIMHTLFSNTFAIHQ